MNTEKTASEKYLTIGLDCEGYALSVLKVREIIRLTKINPVAQMPDYMKGVLNLRGRIIPVIDLRLRFGMKAVVSDRTCIVIVTPKTASPREALVGLIVDSVEDVASVPAADIQPMPDLGVQVKSSALLGLAKVKGQVRLVLDVDRVVAEGDLGTVTLAA